MALTSSYAMLAAFGSLVLIPDPTTATPPLALNPFHLVGTKALRSVRVGPITGVSGGVLQPVRMAVWGWDGYVWDLLHDNVIVRQQSDGGVDRVDAVELGVPRTKAYTAVCVLPRSAAMVDGPYTFNIAATDAPRWTC